MRLQITQRLGAAAVLLFAVGELAAAVCDNGWVQSGNLASCAVFEAADGNVSMSHGDPTGVGGDLCMGPGSELSMSGGQIVTGTAFLDFQVANVPDDLADRASAVVQQDLVPAVLQAEAAAADLAALGCDIVLDEFKVKESQVLFVGDVKPAGGTAVVCVDGNMEVAGSGTMLSLEGDSGDAFVFRVGGAFKVNGAKIAVIGGLPESNVVYFLDGPGKDVAFSGGGGGIGCCKAEIDGSIFALERKIALSPGKVNGQVISGRNIGLSSGSLVTCRPVDDDDDSNDETET